MATIIEKLPNGRYKVWANFDGKRRTRNFTSRDAARKFAADIELAHARGEFRVGERKPVPTLERYGERWMAEHVRTNCEPSTYRGYKLLRDNHINPVLGEKRLDELTRDNVKALAARKIDEGMSQRSVHYIVRTLSAIFNRAKEDGLVTANPAEKPGRIVRPGSRLERIDFLTPAEGRRLLESAKEPFVKKPYRKNQPRKERVTWFYAFVLTALRTGMRLGERIALQWGDLDWTGNFIEVRQTAWSGQGVLPKNGNVRRVDMSDQLKAVLVDYRRKTAEIFLAKGMTLPGLVFPSDAGTMLGAANVRKVFEACLAKAGLRKIRFHDLRHSFASWLIVHGESLAYVKDQLGHYSIQITVDTYGHLIPGANRQAVNRLDDPGWKERRRESPPPAHLSANEPSTRLAILPDKLQIYNAK